MVAHEVLAGGDTDTGRAALLLARSARAVPDVPCPITTAYDELGTWTRWMHTLHTYHKVVSKMAEWESKNLNGSHPEAGQNAMGVPQLSGSGAPEEMSDGMSLRGKNQTEIPLSIHCTVPS